MQGVPPPISLDSHLGKAPVPESSKAVVAIILLVILVAVVQVLPLTRAIIEFDITRDLQTGFAILDGDQSPRHGPQIGGLFHLGPWWFYVVAAVLAISGSLTQYTLILGAIASLKFAVAAWVGWSLGGVRFAALVVAAAALPGLAAYQFVMITHTNFVELFLWLTVAACLSLRRPGLHVPKLVLTGLAFAISVHAHPTVIGALPLLLIGTRLAAADTRVWLRDLLWLALPGVLTLLPVLPDLPTEFARALDPAQRGPLAREAGDQIASVLPLLRGVLWGEPLAFAGTAFADGARPPLAWRVAWVAIVGSGLLGAVIALFRERGPLRTISAAALLSTLWLAVCSAMLVRVTPFYAAYMVLVPLALLLACGWLTLSRLSGWRLTAPLIAAAALSLQAATALALTSHLSSGWAGISIFAPGGIKQNVWAPRVEPYITIRDLDLLARHACNGERIDGSLNGPGIVAVDTSNGYSFRLVGGKACRAAARYGGRSERAQAIIPKPLADRMALDFDTVLGSQALVKLHDVVLPAPPSPLSDRFEYPLRISDLAESKSVQPWQIDFEAPASDWMVVTPIAGLVTGSIEVSANGAGVVPLFSTSIFRAFRCVQCTAPVRWTIRAERIPRSLLNVVTLPRRPGAQ